MLFQQNRLSNEFNACSCNEFAMNDDRLTELLNIREFQIKHQILMTLINLCALQITISHSRSAGADRLLEPNPINFPRWMLYLLDAQLKMYTIFVSLDFRSTKWLIIHIAESVAFSSNTMISQFQNDFSSTWKSSIFNANDQFHSSFDFKDGVFLFLFRLNRILFQNRFVKHFLWIFFTIKTANNSNSIWKNSTDSTQAQGSWTALK